MYLFARCYPNLAIHPSLGTWLDTWVGTSILWIAEGGSTGNPRWYGIAQVPGHVPVVYGHW